MLCPNGCIRRMCDVPTIENSQFLKRTSATEDEDVSVVRRQRTNRRIHHRDEAGSGKMQNGKQNTGRPEMEPCNGIKHAGQPVDASAED